MLTNLLDIESESDKKKVDAITQSILTGLRNETEKGGHPVPNSVLSFGLFLNRHLGREEIEWLDTYELEYGRQACNDWLISVLVHSGYYEKHNDFVKPKC